MGKRGEEERNVESGKKKRAERKEGKRQRESKFSDQKKKLMHIEKKGKGMEEQYNVNWEKLSLNK